MVELNVVARGGRDSSLQLKQDVASCELALVIDEEKLIWVMAAETKVCRHRLELRCVAHDRERLLSGASWLLPKAACNAPQRSRGLFE